MCGIAGLAGGFVPGLAREMGLRQAHRGPDGSGVFEDPAAGIALGHVRLAILDLTDAGAQPMSTPDGRHVIVYNGEIYNYKDLRARLIARGERFVSTGDTEVLLRGLALEGEDFLTRLNGMFALALWDRRERELLLARDPLGVKPLYYVEPEPGCLLFASEIKALLAHPRIRRAPDFEALLQHLAFCHACGDRTAFEGIRRLPPGMLLRWGRSTRLRRYWRAPFGDAARGSRGASVARLRETLAEATTRQLISDVPVGSFFSGGIDSTLVTALAGSHPLRCYTVTYPSSENVLDGAVEDAPYARRVAAILGLSHREREIKPDVVTLLPKLIYHLDEPLADPAVIACYLVSEQARLDGRPVLLSGQGGDELFAGYPRYRAMLMTRWAGMLPAGLRRRIAAVARSLPGAYEGTGGAVVRRARRLLTSLDGDLDRRFLSYAASTPDAAIFEVLRPEVLAALG
ncbi:MAG: asparagine synthase (glutamine-hydrolyzing), partial [Candidatus Polarisedimenticolia bacterium]